MSKIDYEITVDVRNLSVEEKKKVQDAFFKLGFKWLINHRSNTLLNDKDVNRYTNWWASGYAGPLRWTYSDNRAPTHTPEQLYKLAGIEDGLPDGVEPFDLERALAGDTVVTRNGRNVSQLTLFNSKNIKFPLIAVVDDKLNSFTKEGKHLFSGEADRYDLFMLKSVRTINGFEVPAPMQGTLRHGEYYYTENLSDSLFYSIWRWEDDSQDCLHINRGIAYSNKEAAIASAKARLGIDPHKEE